MDEASRKLSNRIIPWYFVAFFLFIAIVDGIFVYVAISTHTGVVTEKSYETGLEYNSILEQARTQPKINDSLTVTEGLLEWRLVDKQNVPITNAKASARFIRPTQAGYDFEIHLEHMENGIYKGAPAFPLKGVWTANLKSSWDSKQYMTSKTIIIK